MRPQPSSLGGYTGKGRGFKIRLHESLPGLGRRLVGSGIFLVATLRRHVTLL